MYSEDRPLTLAPAVALTAVTTFLRRTKSVGRSFLEEPPRHVDSAAESVVRGIVDKSSLESPPSA